jgi:hypothetical protein
MLQTLKSPPGPWRAGRRTAPVAWTACRARSLSRFLHEVNRRSRPGPYWAKVRVDCCDVQFVSSGQFREVPPHRLRQGQHGTGKAIPERSCGLGQARVAEATVAAYVEADEPFGLFANGRSQLVPTLCREIAPLVTCNAL